MGGKPLVQRYIHNAVHTVLQRDLHCSQTAGISNNILSLIAVFLARVRSSTRTCAHVHTHIPRTHTALATLSSAHRQHSRKRAAWRSRRAWSSSSIYCLLRTLRKWPTAMTLPRNPAIMSSRSCARCVLQCVTYRFVWMCMCIYIYEYMYVWTHIHPPKNGEIALWPNTYLLEIVRMFYKRQTSKIMTTIDTICYTLCLIVFQDF